MADILSCPSIKGYGGKIPFILDCIGSKEGSLRPLARIAGGGARVAVLLPVLVREKEEGEEGGKGGPVYGMDVKSEAEWREGVDVRGVRTHFYLEVCIVFVFIYLPLFLWLKFGLLHLIVFWR